MGCFIFDNISKSNIWNHCRLFTLILNMRLRNTTSYVIFDFNKWLLDLGDGRIPNIAREFNIGTLFITISNRVLIHSMNDSVCAMASYTYLDFWKKFTNIKYLNDQAILSSTNEMVDK
ncbi:hypothetical protein ES319_A04G060600v1, partial [Gossypium barbadense]